MEYSHAFVSHIEPIFTVIGSSDSITENIYNFGTFYIDASINDTDIVEPKWIFKFVKLLNDICPSISFRFLNKCATFVRYLPIFTDYCRMY